ncbi:hypothetical protein Tco_0026963 [Tanacetum coccineum]
MKSFITSDSERQNVKTETALLKRCTKIQGEVQSVSSTVNIQDVRFLYSGPLRKALEALAGPDLSPWKEDQNG